MNPWSLQDPFGLWAWKHQNRSLLGPCGARGGRSTESGPPPMPARFPHKPSRPTGGSTARPSSGTFRTYSRKHLAAESFIYPGMPALLCLRTRGVYCESQVAGTTAESQTRTPIPVSSAVIKPPNSLSPVTGPWLCQKSTLRRWAFPRTSGPLACASAVDRRARTTDGGTEGPG